MASKTKTRLRASAVCVVEEELLLVLLRDPLSGAERLFPPGGGIEAGEDALACALREALEETGYRVRALPRPPVVARYPFVWEGVSFDCTTTFFLCTLDEPMRAPGLVSDAPYHRGVVWIPVREAATSLGYDETIRAAVLGLIGS